MIMTVSQSDWRPTNLDMAGLNGTPAGETRPARTALCSTV